MAVKKQVRITHKPSGEIIAEGPLGWGITSFEGNYYIRSKYLKTSGFNYLPGLCIYKFLYIWLDFNWRDGKTRNLGWLYWLPNPAFPFIWFREGEYTNGITCPDPRFTLHDDVVLDQLTGLYWTRNANLPVFPMNWQESFDFINQMNQDNALGYSDWRLPNRRELRSLMSYQTRLPALPDGHPFCDVFSGWYWSSTTAVINPGYAWYVHMEGARMFYGGKDQSYLVWPVRGESHALLQTGQSHCYDASGHILNCAETQQDGETRAGVT